MVSSHEIEVYVRFCETDAVGHVNNTSHFLYFEEARTKFFKKVHLDRSPSFSFILASIDCNYINQAYADQTLIVTTNISKVGTKSFTLRHKLTEKDTGKNIAESEAVIACFNYEGQKAIPITEQLREKLLEYLA